jgi:hypothetical protein
VSQEDQYADEQHIAVGGVQYPRAGCLLIPFIPLRVAGLLIVSSKRLVFDPILHYKLVTRKMSLDIDEISEVEVSGGNVGLSLLNIVNVGKLLTVTLKSGKRYHFRSTAAEMLAGAIHYALHGGEEAPEEGPENEREEEG